MHLIKATEDPFSFRVVWGSVSKTCEVLCGVLIMDLLWLNSFKIEEQAKPFITFCKHWSISDKCFGFFKDQCGTSSSFQTLNSSQICL